jgi:hypothetical protein
VGNSREIDGTSLTKWGNSENCGHGANNASLLQLEQGVIGERVRSLAVKPKEMTSADRISTLQTTSEYVDLVSCERILCAWLWS